MKIAVTAGFRWFIGTGHLVNARRVFAVWIGTKLTVTAWRFPANENLMKTGGKLLLCAVVVALVVGTLKWWPEDSTVRVRDSKTVENAMREAASGASEFPEPTAWDAALFLPLSFTNETLSRFVGAVVAAPLKKVPDLRLAVQEVSMTGDFGQTPVRIKLRASTSDGKEIADVVADGRFLFLGFTPPSTPDEKAKVKFGVAIDSLSLERKLGSWTIAPRRWLAELAADQVMVHFEERLSFDFAVPFDLSYDAKYDAEHQLKTVDDGWVKIHVKAEGTTISQSVVRANALFVPRGFWLGVKFKGGGDGTPRTMPTAPLPQLLAAYEKEASDGVRAWLNGAFLARTLDDLGKLSPEARTATVEVDTHEGALLNDNWYDKVLGKGGIEVRLENDDGGGKATLTPHAQWTPEGLVVGLDVTGDADVDLHVHVDPLVGGGVGTSLGAHGEISGKGSAVMRMSAIGTNARAFLLFPEVLANSGLQVQLKTDGKLKFDLLGKNFTMDVPGLGARASLSIPAGILPRIAVLTNEPFLVGLPKLAEAGTKNGIALPDSLRSTYIVFDPQEASLSSGGYFLTANASLKNLTPNSAKEQRELVRNELRQPKPDTRIAVGDVEVLIGDLAFGSNNDLIKFFLTAVNTLKDAIDEVEKAGKAVEREARKIAKETGKAIGEGGKVVAQEVKDWPKDVKREVIKPVANAAEAVGGALKDAAGAVGGAAKDAAGAVGGAAKDAAGAVGKALGLKKKKK